MKVSESIRRMMPYVPGKPIEETRRQYGIKEVYKLASNENPLGPSPKAMEALRNSLEMLHLYPDGSAYQLRKKMAEHFKVDENQLLFGNGSDEIVDFLVRVFCERGDKILTSHRAFDTYRLSAQASGCETTLVPMTQDYKFDLEGLRQAWTPKHKLIFITNPNNPTGTYCGVDDLSKFISYFGNIEDVLIVIDEAYFEYVRAKDYPHSLDFVRKYPNVVCLRTMSKVYGLAGLRLGIMVANPEVVGFVNRVRKPFNVNSLIQVAAIAALEDREFVKKTCELTWKGLDYFYKELGAMGLEYIPSQGNFVLFNMGLDSHGVYEKLLAKGVILRPVKNYGLPTHLRMSVGLEHENKKAIECLKEVLS